MAAVAGVAVKDERLQLPLVDWLRSVPGAAAGRLAVVENQAK